MANGLEIIEMAKEFKYGQMVRDMKENGKKIKLVVKVNLDMSMVMSLMVNGKMIKQMDTEFIFM